MERKAYQLVWMDEIILPVDELIDRYYRPQHLKPSCMDCENYGTNYACPPIDREPEDILKGYTHIRLFGAMLYLTCTVRKEEIDGLYIDGMTLFAQRLYEKETQWENSLALMPGACRLCVDCLRPSGKPCRHPDKLRLSLDAFSLEIAQMSEELFHTPVCWYNDSQPRYLTMIGGVLIKGIV